MVGWTVGAMVAGGAAVSTQEAPVTRTFLTVAVHVTDYAHISPLDLVNAQAQATDAYRAAGLDIVWSSAPQVPGPGTNAASPSIDVRLVILPRDMAEKKCRAEGLGANVLGEARGRFAFVFYDRIERLAISFRTPVAPGLGYVIAHELGHLLIERKGHTGTGLMRSVWNPHETRLQTFTASQVLTIRDRFTRPRRPREPAETYVASGSVEDVSR